MTTTTSGRVTSSPSPHTMHGGNSGLVGGIGALIEIGLAIGRGVGEGVCTGIGSDVGEICEQPQGAAKGATRGQN